jgi:hypothetical protein
VSRPRDSQRSAVYEWEVRLYGEPGASTETPLTLTECHDLMRRAWEALGGGHRMPTLTDGRRRRAPCYDPVGHQIKLPRHARRASQVLHETTHAIIEQRSLRTLAWHGPEFARVYFEILVMFAGARPQRLRAERGRVSIAGTCDLPWLCSWQRRAAGELHPAISSGLASGAGVRGGHERRRFPGAPPRTG